MIAQSDQPLVKGDVTGSGHHDRLIGQFGAPLGQGFAHEAGGIGEVEGLCMGKGIGRLIRLGRHENPCLRVIAQPCATRPKTR